MDEILESIADAIANVESSDRLSNLVSQALAKHISALEILEKGLRKGLRELGRKYENGEYFLSELLYGASMIDQGMKIIGPNLKTESPGFKGRIVLGTVKGDIHDIGKNIFRLIAEASGFKVDDLGVDVAPEQFLQAVIKNMPDVVGLSSLLTTTLSDMSMTIEELRRTEAKDRVKVLLGGNAVTESFRKETGADAAALDAVEGVNLCVRWVSK